jgi:transcriptional regulator with XRE-family HTH domain
MLTDINARIAAEVRAEVARQQLTQQQLGERMGRPQHWISRRLTGDVPFTADELVTFAAALGVPVSRFLGDGVPA